MAKIVQQLPILFALVLLAFASVIGAHEHTYRQLSAGLTRAITSARAQRWKRPVLRGAMRDGNAANEIYNAMQDFEPLGESLRHDLAEKVYFGQPLGPELQRAITMRALPLRALRDSVQQGWSRTDLAIERGTHMLVPDYPKLLEAALALLAQAQTSEPTGCLQLTADVLRIGQDIVPLAPLEAASVGAHIAAFGARVMTRCAKRAELPALRRASHELRVLATHPAPIGTALELETLAAAQELEEQAALVGKSPVGVVETLLDRSRLMAAWKSYAHPEALRQVLPEHYPDALEIWQREHDLQTRVSPESPEVEAHVVARLIDDMRAQAIVRSLCVALTALAERAYRGKLPAQPAALREPGLADPYQGQPLRYRIAPNGAELMLWAVGPDHRDDGGSDEWTDAGPRDITVHVALR